MVLPILILAVMFTALLLSYPWAVLTLVSLTYLALIPLSVHRYNRHLRRTEAAEKKPESEAGQESASDKAESESA